MAHDYWVPLEERSLPAPDAVGRLLPMFDGSMQPHGDEIHCQKPTGPHGMRRYCANNGCSSILGPGWQYLRCRMCLKPPPPAQPSGDHDSSHELTTEVQQALSVDVAPVVAPTSCGGVEEDPKEPTPTPSAGKRQAFLLGVDGSGGEDVWAVGLIDWQSEEK